MLKTTELNDDTINEIHENVGLSMEVLTNWLEADKKDEVKRYISYSYGDGCYYYAHGLARTGEIYYTCGVHNKRSKHPISVGPDRPCLEIDPN